MTYLFLTVSGSGETSAIVPGYGTLVTIDWSITLFASAGSESVEAIVALRSGVTPTSGQGASGPIACCACVGPVGLGTGASSNKQTFIAVKVPSGQSVYLNVTLIGTPTGRVMAIIGWIPDEGKLSPGSLQRS